MEKEEEGERGTCTLEGTTILLSIRNTVNKVEHFYKHINTFPLVFL